MRATAVLQAARQARLQPKGSSKNLYVGAPDRTTAARCCSSTGVLQCCASRVIAPPPTCSAKASCRSLAY